MSIRLESIVKKIESIMEKKNLKLTGRDGKLGVDDVVKYHYSEKKEYNLLTLTVYINYNITGSKYDNFSVILHLKGNGPLNNNKKIYIPYKTSKAVKIINNGKQRLKKISDFPKKFEPEVDHMIELITTTELETIANNIISLDKNTILTSDKYFFRRPEYITTLFDSLDREEELMEWAVKNDIVELIPKEAKDLFLF